MSWSSSYLPSSRRSRSRSPRGSYPPRSSYPDSSYPGDTYRSDWDSYDRDRWSSYDRDRGTYDYGRRRSRSPPSDESRKRRRSVSPYDRDRDRYDPRPRYNDDYDTHSRGYGYASPPRRGPPGSYQTSRRPPPDPHTFEFPATLKQYADWFRFFHPQQALEEDNADKAAEQEAGDGSKPRNGIRSRWEKYKKEFAANQLQTMFDHHRKSPWFAEKYDPDFQNLRFRVRKEGWKGRITTFLDDLESGKFDPDLNETEPEPPSPAKDTSSNNEITTETNGTTAEESKPSGGDDEMQFTVEVDEEVVDPDVSRVEANGKHSSDSRRSNRGEEVSVPPEGNQVMIRTIPPDIGRVKLEEACTKVPGFVYLALGDPLQKRNFYRAGWIRFHDEADMITTVAELGDKKIEGFKLHVSHVIKPFTNRVRYTPDVASRPERLEKDLANAKVLVAQLEDEAAKLRSMKISELKVKPKANSEPKPDEDAAMAPPEEILDEEQEMEPRERGSEGVERRIEKIMADLREQGLVDVNNETEYEEKKTVVSLDLYLAYLRTAFHTCYYCAVITDHLEELQRKCIKHERKPWVPTPTTDSKFVETENGEKDKKADDSEKDAVEQDREARDKDGKDKKDDKRNDGRWLEWLDSKIALLINRDGVDPREYGGKSYEEELSKAAEPHIKQEDEGKFRCKTCQKLFRATSFVEKHIANKHPELVKYLDDLPYFNNFVLDPHRIQPFTHPPPTVGNASQAPPPQAYGIQGPAYHGDYGRVGGHYPYPPGPYPPPPYNGYWDPYAYPYGPPAPYPPPPMPPRRDEGVNSGRRLSERISGFATETTVPAGAGLPPKPSPAALDSALTSGSGNSGNGTARRNTRNNGQAGGPPPPPPPDAKEDPRAAAGKRVSYHDMDLVAEGDVELFY